MGNLIHLRYLVLYRITKLSREDLKAIFQLYHLQTLSLSYCNIEEIPKEIGNLIHLRFLDLSWNQSLKELPMEIGNLIQLRHLDLSQNQSLKELPMEIGNLIQLRHLDLSWNKLLKELPMEIGNLIQLRHLDLSRNDLLKEIPMEIGNLIQLRHLDLSGNELLKELPMEIGNLIQLRHLDLSWNKLLKELPMEIGNLIQLRHLDLSQNQSLKELPMEIGNLIQLRHLDLSWNKLLKELPMEIGNLIQLRHLDLSGNELLKELPMEIGNLIHLRFLDLSQNQLLKELPMEIGNLIQLRHLDLSRNELLKELPMEIGNLIQLRHLYLSWNKSLKELPECICDLQELQTLDNEGCESLCRIPERLVPILREFPGGIGGSKMELLKNMKHVNGKLRLRMKLDDDGDLNEVVEDSRRADLRNEINITDFELSFIDKMGEEGSSSLSWVWMDVMDALEPHPNLNDLKITGYGGSKLPRWMVSPLNQLRKLTLRNCKHLTSLPAFGKLPCLEDISLLDMEALEIVGRDFLGITRGGGGGCDTIIAFPKLKKLNLRRCSNWKEWEDITEEEEEECAASSIMPCLTQLRVRSCNGLRMLPHRLLRKVSSLKTVNISFSTELKQRYRDKDGSDWKSISVNNPALHLIML
ncbi:hypothetical protein ACS0TY_012283 [Phlomoides rotata]